jgi:hypothetical protein
VNDFTASNGITIAEEVTTLSSGALMHGALREFFRAEEDARLGRWRWPENPDITVRVAPKHAQPPGGDGGTVMIQQDSDGYVGYYDRDSLPEITDKTGGIVRAGHAYFDAHPEPKPWHDAGPAEVWDVDLSWGGMRAVTVYSGRHDEPITVFRDAHTQTEIETDDPGIRDARRIYPGATS